MNFGETIREARKTQHLTAEAVATTIGISATHYSRIENGQRILSDRHKVERLAALLNLDTDTLWVAMQAHRLPSPDTRSDLAPVEGALRQLPLTEADRTALLHLIRRMVDQNH